jgi:hypothetical protein
MWFHEANSTFDFYEFGVPDPLVTVSSTGNGGSVEIFDAAGVQRCDMYTSSGTQSGYLTISGNDGWARLTGTGTYGPEISITSSMGGMSIDPNNPDRDRAVRLFSNTINTHETTAEAGVAANQLDGGVNLSEGSVQTVLSRTLTTPNDTWTNGYVIAIGTAVAQFLHTTGTYTRIDFDVSDSAEFPFAHHTHVYFPADMPSAWYEFPITTQVVFELDSPGSKTFYMLAEPTNSGATFYAPRLTLIYVPTPYGTVSTAQSAGLGGSVQTRGGMTAAEIAAERAEAEAYHRAQVDQELAAMRAELDAVKAELRSKRQ